MRTVNQWITRTRRKKPKLFEATVNQVMPMINIYYIIFKDRGKVKIGSVRDNMYIRYGIATFGSLSSVKPLYLWELKPDSVSPEQLNEMIKYWNNESELDDFDVSVLYDLRY